MCETDEITRTAEAPEAVAPEPNLPIIELVALRLMPTAIRCHEIGGGRVTYRKTAPHVIPGMRLVVGDRKRWPFHGSRLVSGPLYHVGFSTRALWQAGFERPAATPDGLTCPGSDSAALREAMVLLEGGEWMAARCRFLDVLEAQPGCLVAHAAMGRIMAEACHVSAAIDHYTAAIRLGMRALSSDDCLPLDASRTPERLLLQSLLERSRLLLDSGSLHAGAADLRRAVAWDPSDALGARCLLESLEATAADAAADATGATSP